MIRLELQLAESDLERFMALIREFQRTAGDMNMQMLVVGSARTRAEAEALVKRLGLQQVDFVKQDDERVHKKERMH